MGALPRETPAPGLCCSAAHCVRKGRHDSLSGTTEAPAVARDLISCFLTQSLAELSKPLFPFVLQKRNYSLVSAW